MKIPALLLFFMGLSLAYCQQTAGSQAAMANPAKSDSRVLPASDKINGLTFVAPPEPFPENPMPSVQSTGAS